VPFVSLARIKIPTVSFPGWHFLIYAFAVGTRLNLRAIKLPERMKKRLHLKFQGALFVTFTARREKLQAFFSSRLSFVQNKNASNPEVCINLAL